MSDERTDYRFSYPDDYPDHWPATRVHLANGWENMHRLEQLVEEKILGRQDGRIHCPTDC